MLNKAIKEIEKQRNTYIVLDKNIYNNARNKKMEKKIKEEIRQEIKIRDLILKILKERRKK